MVDGGIHDHVGDRGGQGVALCHTLVPLERVSKLSAGPGHHGKSSSVRPEESERPGTDPVS